MPRRPQLRDRPISHRRDEIPRRSGGRGRRRDARRGRAGARLVRVDVEELPRSTPWRRPGGGCAARPGPRSGRRPARRHERPRAPLRMGRRRGGRTRTDVVVEGAYPSRWSPSSPSSPTRSWPRRQGGIVVWSAIQHPNWLQRVIADLVRLPLSKVRIIAPDPGGGFGGKQHAKYEPLVAFMALRLGRPVRLVLTLEETFQAVRRGAAEVRVRSGFARRHPRVPRHRRELPDRRVRRHRGPDRGQGQPHVDGPVSLPAAGSSRGACCRIPCRPPRSAGSATRSRSGRPIEHGRGRASSWHRPARTAPRNLAGPATRSSRRHAGRRGVARGLRRAAELIGWGDPVPAGRGAASRWASSRARRPGSRIRPSACSRTAASSSTPARRTWARARGRSSPRSRPASSARRSSGSRS